jgi:NADH dehydrogenase
VRELAAGRPEVTVSTVAGEDQRLSYDHLVIGLGSVTKTMPVPGLAEHAIGFTSVAEANFLRDHVLHQLEAAACTGDRDARRRALTFVVVGGGYTGVEALGELADMTNAVAAGYPGLDGSRPRWVMVQAGDRLLPTVSGALAERALAELRGRGVDVRLNTTAEKVGEQELQLSDGQVLPTATVIWVAGVAPEPAVAALGLPCDDDGRLCVDEYLRVPGWDGTWGAGDCAAVPNAATGQLSPPTAQQAVRQARTLADNVLAHIRGRWMRRFVYRSRGEFVTLGRHKAVGEVYGRQLDGMSAWLARRAYYASQIPTGNRKLRTVLDWTVGLPFGHDVVDFTARQRPHEPLRRAAGG